MPTDTSKQAVEFIRYILEQICERKDLIEIDLVPDDKGLLINITIDNEDMGKVIGRGGRTISSLRTLVHIIGAREQQKFILNIVDSSS